MFRLGSSSEELPVFCARFCFRTRVYKLCRRFARTKAFEVVFRVMMVMVVVMVMVMVTVMVMVMVMVIVMVRY